MPFHFPLQPRAGTTSPLPQPAQPAAPSQGTADPSATPASQPGGTELSQPTCEAASRSLVIVSGAYAAGAALIGVALFVVLKKQLLGSRAVRYLAGAFLAGALAAVLVGIDPARADDVTRCINSAEYARYVVLAGSGAARAVLLGFLPAAVLALIGCAVANRAY